MSDIDWNAIADAIRERRFDDVSPDVWHQIADKIDTKERKKRGRGRPSNCDLGREHNLIHGLFRHMMPLAGGMTWAERCLWFEERHKLICKEGLKRGNAIKQIANDKGWSVKTVEAALTASKKYKGYIEAVQKTPIIMAGIMSACQMSLDEDGNQINDPDLKGILDR